MRPFAKSSLLVAVLWAGLMGTLPHIASAQTAPNVAPTLIPISGELRAANGQPRTGNVLLVLALYESKDDTAPRWIEHQAVTLDAAGRYSVNFGGTRDEGLPADLFAGPAGMRWVGVAVENEAEQPRVALVSVPYAAKAASADTLSGRTLTDFVLTSTLHDDVRAVLQESGGGRGLSTMATDGTLNFLQKADASGTNTVDSTVYETGGNVAIGSTQTSFDATGAAYRLGVRAPNVSVGSYNANVYLETSDAQGTDVGGSLAFGGKTGYSGSRPFAVLSGRKVNNLEGSVGGYFSVATPSAGGVMSERMRVDSYGNVGIGMTHMLFDHTSAPFRLGVKGPNTLPYSYNANVYVETSDAQGVDIGASIALGGQTGITGSRPFAILSGRKADSVNMSVGGYFAISTPNAGGSIGERLRVDSLGNVGIGTSNPTSRLHVVGDATVTGDMVVNGNIGAKYQDVAEWVDAAEPVDAGTVVVIDPTSTNRVRAATKSYATTVAGAVSAQPGIVLGEGGEGRVLVAQSGRVKVKADAKFGAIRPGDLLVTSPTEAHVMRSRPTKLGESLMHRPGTLVGKALEALPSGRGEILVLLTLQ